MNPIKWLYGRIWIAWLGLIVHIEWVGWHVTAQEIVLEDEALCTGGFLLVLMLVTPIVLGRDHWLAVDDFRRRVTNRYLEIGIASMKYRWGRPGRTR